MQNFLLPSSIHSELDKIYRDFIWNKDPTKKSTNSIGWDKICKPKHLGSLGIKKSEATNQALQMKLLWKIMSEPENLWVKFVTKRYLHSDSHLAHTPPQSSSWQWRKLMLLRETFKKGLRWQIGNGCSVNFWLDNWVSQKPLLGIAQTPCVDQNIKVCEFISQNNT